eukprot:6475893-Amphidinium_carterae.1
MGFDDNAIQKFHRAMHQGQGPHLQGDFRDQLRQLGVPDKPFQNMDAEDALRIHPEKLGGMLPVGWHRIRFQQWRQKRLVGELVTEELVTLGAFVERGPGWRYDPDSDDDITPADGGQGHGHVLGWRSAEGVAHPEEGQKGPKDALPTRPGWVRVEWYVTGHRGNYRLGKDLQFAPQSEHEHASKAALEEVGD